jgi:hypothetical protein
MNSAISSFLRTRYALAAAVIWLAWYAVSLAIKAWFRSQKDPSQYTGVCYRPNGYAMDCSIDNWLVWDASPWVEIYLVVGAILAAAATGWLFFRHLRNARTLR